MKFTVGLTGGIGSGKTTVANRFQALGADVIDADEISRRITAAGGDAMPAVLEAFGAQFAAADGSLDRAAMRRLAFTDPSARARLEAILHPAIRGALAQAVAKGSAPYAIVVVPLLFETGGRDRVARTLAIDCDEALQVARVAARSGLSAEEVRRIMAAQWPRWRRLQLADDVIWNGGEPAALEPQCLRLHADYRRRAAAWT